MRSTVYPPSEKQLNFIESLRRQREDADQYDGIEPQSSQEASQLIGQLLALKPREANRKFVTQDGMYRNPHTGDIFKVQRNKAQGDGSRLYGKKLVIVNAPTLFEDGSIDIPAKIKFEYAPGILGVIDPSWKMSMEEAEEFGALYGICVRCGRTLTKEESIERALGPICAGYF